MGAKTPAGKDDDKECKMSMEISGGSKSQHFWSAAPNGMHQVNEDTLSG